MLTGLVLQFSLVMKYCSCVENNVSYLCLQDRIMKTLLYIVSLSDICQPFLIITTSSMLPLWEAEFLRAVPSVDIVVYNGSSDNRKCIRTQEFNDDDNRIMLQVLLSSVEIVVEVHLKAHLLGLKLM